MSGIIVDHVRRNERSGNVTTDTQDTHTEFIVAWTTLPETRKYFFTHPGRSSVWNLYQHLKMKFAAKSLNPLAEHFLSCDALVSGRLKLKLPWLRAVMKR
jgi:hypothetical protein